MKNFLFKKASSLFFILYSFFKEDRIIKKLKKEKNLEKNQYNENIKNHPAYVFFTAYNYIDSNKISEGFKLIENFNEIKKIWSKKTNLEKVIVKDILPPCRVMGSFGNYRTVFAYLFNRINILKIIEKPKIYVKKFDKINNKFLLSLFKPFLNFNNNSYSFYKNINNIFYLKAPIEISLPYKKKYYPWAISENLINQYRLKNKNLNFNFLELNQSDYLAGKKILSKNNLSNYKWYVALHIREDKKEGTQSHRNANPKNYIKLIKEIISRGGAVFRVGDSSMTPLPNINGLIDYPFSNLKSEFMDIFLAATSKFVVGTASGYWTAASFFNTPLLMTNYVPAIDYYSFNQNCIFMPKTLVNKKNQIVPIEDIYNKNKYSYYTTKKQFEDNSLKIEENTEDELLESVKNMFDLLSNQKDEHKDNFLYLNKQFKKNYFKENFYEEHKLLPLANFSSAYIKKYI